MTEKWLQRTELILGEQALGTLKNSHVLVVGLGGVGSFAAEFLARSGVGALTIADGDVVDATNINRQLPALQSTIGVSKIGVMKNRLSDINDQLKITCVEEFLSPERMEELLEANRYDYIADCIDSVSPKISLITAARKRKLKIISSMGAGGKLDPAKVLVRDISKTNNCFLAKQIRKRLRKDNIHKGFRCVFSTEIQDVESLQMTDGSNFKKSYYGTVSYIPALFGLYAASEIIRFLINKKDDPDDE